MRRRVSLGEHSVPGAKVLLSLLELHFGGITVCCCTEPSKGNVVLLIRRRAVGREGLLSAVHIGCEHGRHGRERADSGGSLPVWLPMIAATRPPSCTLTNRRPKCGQASCIRHTNNLDSFAFWRLDMQVSPSVCLMISSPPSDVPRPHEPSRCRHLRHALTRRLQTDQKSR
jgi:hypothetical protein